MSLGGNWGEEPTLEAETFRLVVEHLRDAVVVTERGRVVYANHAALALWGLPRESFVGRPAAKLSGADDRDEVAPRLGAAQDAGSSAPLQHRRIHRPDGTWAIAEWASSSVAVDGRVFVVGVAREMTERWRLQSEVVLADRLASVGQLASALSHDINNPLAYVLTNLEYALRELDGPVTEAKRRAILRALTDAREGATRVARLVQELHQFARSDDHEVAEPVALGPIVERTTKLVRNEIRHRARLVLDLGDVPPVLGHPWQISQILLNLLLSCARRIPVGNARDHELRLMTRAASDGRVVIEVRDPRAILSPDELARIFEPFWVPDEAVHGGGLGFAICRTLVARLGGEMTAVSEPGCGSAFTVHLPAAPQEGPVRGDRPAAPPARPASGVTVIVIDDEPAIGEALARVLGDDHRVIACASARDAIERIRREPVDVILCDLMMPDVSGMELYDVLARTVPDALEKLVFMTGGAFTESARRFLERIPNERLEKPIDLDRLAEILARRAGAKRQ